MSYFIKKIQFSGFIQSTPIKPIDFLLMLLIIMLPFGYMANKSFFGVNTGLLLITSFFILHKYNYSLKKLTNQKYFYFLCLYMFAGTVALLVTQIISNRFLISAYDGPARLWLVFPFLAAIFIRQINFSKLLALTLPLALLNIGIYAHFHYGIYGDRMTVNYLDPIIWGNSCIILGFVSLFSIQKSDSLAFKSYKTSGLLIGIWLSLLSQSRAGWVAAIALFILWLFLNRETLSIKKVSAYLLAACLAGVLLYLCVDSVKFRIDTAIFEILAWHNKTQIESSTGYRLTMWKISLYLFSKHPWLGYGDLSLSPFLNDPYILSFADPESIKTIQCCGPHNEVMAHLLRSGLFGIAALVGTYIVPIWIFIKTKDHQTKSMGLAFCGGISICALSTEMLSLKFIYTFYGLVMAGLIGTSLWKNNINNAQK